VGGVANIMLAALLRYQGTEAILKHLVKKKKKHIDHSTFQITLYDRYQRPSRCFADASFGSSSTAFLMGREHRGREGGRREERDTCNT